MDSNETISKLEDSRQGIITGTYILIVFSIIAMGYNYWMFIYIGKNYPKTATYQILGIDCLLTCPSQFGMILMMLGSMGKYDNKLLCTIATGLTAMAFSQPIVSCLFVAIIS